MEKKICSKCKAEKEVCDFGIHNSTKDRLRKVCKDCRKIEEKIYREKNPEKRKIRSKKWKDKNPEYNKNYYLKNIEKINKTKKTWSELNKEKVKKDKRIWRENNIDKVREYYNNRIKKQRKSEPLKKLIFNVRSRISSILKNKRKNTFNIVGCSPEFLKEYLEKKFKNGMSWENQGKWHIDHIMPLSSAKTEEEIYELCHYTNLQPLWAEDNLRKSNKILN
jgi:hypothetical protein